MTRRVRVKICGLTRAEDAALAVRLGADAIGFVFWPRSPRAVSPGMVAQIVRNLPPLVTRVGVFVNATPGEVAETARVAGLDVVQLHGDEDIAAFGGLPVRIMRAVSLASDEAVATAAALPSQFLPLVDADDADRRGGTGARADWTRAARLSAVRPIVLAGGLTATNVGEAIATVRPWALDVSSGVESLPGHKSPERMGQFFAAVRRAQQEED